MADIVIPDPEGFAKLLKVADQMRYGVLIILGILLIVGLVAYMLHRYWMLKQAAREAELKEARSRRLSDAMNAMANSNLQMAESHATATTRLVEALERVGETVAGMDDSVKVLQQRASGQLSRNLSIRLVRTCYMQSVHPAICDIVRRSLTENRYDERRQFISNRVRTTFAEVFAQARSELGAYPLSFGADLFFPVYANDGSERFVLCDQLWDLLEPQYTKKQSLQERIDEAILNITNALQDHLSAVEKEILAGRAESGFRSSVYPAQDPGPTASHKFLTPRPG